MTECEKCGVTVPWYGLLSVSDMGYVCRSCVPTWYLDERDASSFYNQELGEYYSADTESFTVVEERSATYDEHPGVVTADSGKFHQNSHSYSRNSPHRLRITAIVDGQEYDFTVGSHSPLTPANGSDRYEIPMTQAQWPTGMKQNVTWQHFVQGAEMVVSDDQGTTVAGPTVSYDAPNETVTMVDQS